MEIPNPSQIRSLFSKVKESIKLKPSGRVPFTFCLWSRGSHVSAPRCDMPRTLHVPFNLSLAETRVIQRYEVYIRCFTAHAHKREKLSLHYLIRPVNVSTFKELA